jgi:anti-sigma-K factor RskA
MIPENSEELDILAGEYVLGVLDPAVARVVEAALAVNPELRRAVILWEERLQPLSVLAAPVAPPPAIWNNIAARVGETGGARPRLWHSLALWRLSAAFAAACAACLALYIFLARPAPGPSLVAILHAPRQERPAWVATAGRNGLSVRALAGAAAPRGRSFELWAIAPGAKKAVSLGVIPANGRLQIAAFPQALRQGGKLAISVEPEGGSPTGRATGPIVFVGSLVATK